MLKQIAKRGLSSLLVAIMLVTSLPLQSLAAMQSQSNPPQEDFTPNYEDLSVNKSDIINKEKPELKVAKPNSGKTAEDLIKNPDQPAIYTLRTDYKVQRGEKYEVDYQPYIASVGESATQAEKDKVKKTIKLPDLAGYEKPDDDYLITYDKVKNAGNNGSQ